MSNIIFIFLTFISIIKVAVYIFSRIVEGSYNRARFFVAKGADVAGPLSFRSILSSGRSGPIETQTWKHYKCGVTPVTSRRRSLLGVTEPARSQSGRTSMDRRVRGEKGGREGSALSLFLGSRFPSRKARHRDAYTRLRMRSFLPTTNSCVTPGPSYSAISMNPLVLIHKQLRE